MFKSRIFYKFSVTDLGSFLLSVEIIFSEYFVRNLLQVYENRVYDWKRNGIDVKNGDL